MRRRQSLAPRPPAVRLPLSMRVSSPARLRNRGGCFDDSMLSFSCCSADGADHAITPFLEVLGVMWNAVRQLPVCYLAWQPPRGLWR